MLPSPNHTFFENPPPLPPPGCVFLKPLSDKWFGLPEDQIETFKIGERMCINPTPETKPCCIAFQMIQLSLKLTYLERQNQTSSIVLTTSPCPAGYFSPLDNFVELQELCRSPSPWSAHCCEYVRQVGFLNDNITVTPPPTNPVSATNPPPVTWHVLIWILFALAISSMAQETGKLCGSRGSSRIYQCSSPILCFADALSMIFHFLASIIFLRVSPPRAARLAVAERFLSSTKNSKPNISTKSAWARWLFFLLGTAPAAVKLASFSGVPWTKTWGMMHLVSFATIEGLTFISTFNPKKWEFETIETLTLYSVFVIGAPSIKNLARRFLSVAERPTSIELNVYQTNAADLEAHASETIGSAATEDTRHSQDLERRSDPITGENLSLNTLGQFARVTSTHSGFQHKSHGRIDIPEWIDRFIESNPSQFEDATESEHGESERSVAIPEYPTRLTSLLDSDIFRDFSTPQFLNKISALLELVQIVNRCLFALAVLSHHALISWAVIKLWYHAANLFRWSHFYYYYQTQVTYTGLALELAGLVAWMPLIIMICVTGTRRLFVLSVSRFSHIPKRNITRIAVVGYCLLVVSALFPSEYETTNIFWKGNSRFSEACSILFVVGSCLMLCCRCIAWACKTWKFLGKILLVEQQPVWSKEGSTASFFFLFFLVNLVVCVLYYCYLYDQKGTTNPR